MKFRDINKMDQVQFEVFQNRLRKICYKDAFDVFMLLLYLRGVSIARCKDGIKRNLLLSDFHTDINVADILFDESEDDQPFSPYDKISGIVKLMCCGFITGYKDDITGLEKFKFEPDIIDQALAGELSQTDPE